MTTNTMLVRANLRAHGRRFVSTGLAVAISTAFIAITMVVMGGLGSMTGSIAGALVVTFLSAALASFPNARMIIYALALILLMFYRPQGLFGYVEVTAMQPLRRFFRKGGEA